MRGTKLIQEPVTREIIGAFYEVYNTLGFGFLDHIYVRRWSWSWSFDPVAFWYAAKWVFVSCTTARDSRSNASISL